MSAHGPENLLALWSRLLFDSLAAAVRAQTNHEHAEQTILRATEDFAEGVRAVQERRPGNFQGR